MNINRQVLEESLQHSCKMVGVFGTSVIEEKGGSVDPNFFLPLYQASEKKKESGSGDCGGLSVLEESHVVGESGQLLLVWNQ